MIDADSGVCPAAPLTFDVVDSAGRRAREDAAVLDRLMETLRLASFRTYLLATVHSMSALVPDVLGMVGSDVSSALQRIRPGHLWPANTRADCTSSRSPGASRRTGIKDAGRYHRPLALCMGDAVIAEGALGDWVEAKIIGGSLDVVLRSGQFELSTQDGTGCIRFLESLPDTVISACAGRALADVVDHPLLRSRSYVIERATQVGGVSSLAFDVGRVGLGLPWRE